MLGLMHEKYDMHFSNSSQNKQDNIVFEVQDIKVYYDNFLVLREVDIEISEKEVIAFIGPSCAASTE